MDFRTEAWIKGGLCLVAIGAVLWRLRAGGWQPPRRAGRLLVLMAAVAAVAYCNFGRFHGRLAVHYWEQFHYFLGSKYFPELGYDGLYLASLKAQRESAPGLPVQNNVRDLRDNVVVPTSQTLGQQEEVKARFSPERWARFVDDNDHFVRANDLEYLRKIRTDHGYNPSPAWTFVAQLVDSQVPATRANLTALGFIDFLLLALMFFAVFHAYGSWVGCLSLIVFGLGYPWRYDWVGGALLRCDWLAATVIGICLLKRGHHLAAGMALGYATLVRVFPVLFLFGPAVQGVRDLVRHADWRWARHLVAGFLLAVVLGLGAGSLTGRGAAAWREFGQNLEKHRVSWLTNNVGVENLLLYGPDTVTRKLVDWQLPEPWIRWQAYMTELRGERRPFILLAQALMLLLIAVAAWRAPRDEAATLGLAVIFTLVLLTCYYWVMLLVLPFQRRVGLTLGYLGVNVVLFTIAGQSFEAIYGFMSWALAGLFLAWTVPAAVAEVRRMRQVAAGGGRSARQRSLR